MQKTITETSLSNSSNEDTYSKLINNLLLKVQKPGQYLGIEWGILVGRESENKKIRTKKQKIWNETKVKTALIYPDLYELGMSNFGTKILYQIINSHSDFLCDRAYAPMSDMEDLLRKEKTSLWGWETFKPLKEFDLLGFSLSYELSYTNVLNILELSNLDVLSANRKNLFPLVFAGGPATFNPEPMADFVDFFIVGDGEEVVVEILNLVKDFKNNQVEKDELLLQLAQIQGIYVPKFYKPDPNENYLPKLMQKMKVPEKITKRVVNLTDSNQPVSGPVPYLASVQDRQTLEIRRGCDRGCRFCQPGYVYLPVRERTPKELLKLSTDALKNTGYDEYSFLSLSASDYTRLHEAAVSLNNVHSKKGISLSMPSQRADRFDMGIANELNTVRKSGITLAPEAGTERLRAVINKGLKEEEIKRAIENVYDSGFSHVKLYFMIGLPTETTKDLDGIIDLLRWAYNLSKTKNKKSLDITCTISTFVPKAFTPFQWFSQNTTHEFEQKINYLKQKVRDYKLKTVKLNCTDPKIALLEVILSRGDRRISKLIFNAYKKGAKFDAWDDRLDINIWNSAASELGIDLAYEATKHRELGSVNPWEIIDSGLLNKFLIEEMNKALKVSETSPCTENTCHACGVCFELGVLNYVTEDKSKNNKFVKEIEKNNVIPTKVGIQNKTEEWIPGQVENDKTFLQKKSPRTILPTKSAQKVEIIHTKTGDLRFISHLDVQRLFERALRRAEIPISFTEGFNPRPKMQWLMPLPLYYESECELMHLELSEHVKDADLQILLNNQLPPEFKLKTVISKDLSSKLPDVNNIKVLYRILTYYPLIWEKYICELKEKIESFLTQSSLILKVEKNKKDRTLKQIDIRSQLEGIKILSTKPLELELVLLGSTRAETVLSYLMPEELKTETPQSNWQTYWKINKQMICNRS